MAKIISGKFKIANYHLAGTEKHDQGNGIIRMHFSVIPNTGLRKKFNNKLVKVHNEGAGKTTYGVLKWAPKLDKDQIALTTSMSDQLEIDRKKEAELKISIAGKGDIHKFFEDHPDPTIRMSELLSRRRSVQGYVWGVVTTIIITVVLELVLDGGLRQFLKSLIYRS